jgi:hypothetical protein
VYLDKAKERFQVLESVRKTPVGAKSSPEEEIQQLQEKLGLKLPEAYKEFLLWAGSDGGPLYSDSCYLGAVMGCNREDAEEILREDQSSEILPEDAIVFTVHHGGYAFCFIRASEGNDPPVHYYYPVPDPNGVTPSQPQIVWNYSSNLNDHCLKAINAKIKARTRGTPQ